MDVFEASHLRDMFCLAKRRSRRAPVSARRLYDGVHVDGKPIPVSHVADKENVDGEKEA